MFILAIAGCVVLGGTVVGWKTEKQTDIVINEVCAHNSTILEQGFYGSCDYIEIYNSGDEGINLKGYGLSDKRNGNPKFVFEDYDLSPGAYVIVFASGEVPDIEEKIFTNFKISDEDTIYLTNERGKIIDYVKLISTTPDIVYARESDGADQWTTMKGSPWAPNEAARKVLVPSDEVSIPVFSEEGGFYEEAFELEMQAEEGCKIFYTLDGSEPYIDDMIYEGPIRIEDASTQENVWRSRTDLSAESYEIATEKVDKAVIVRAIAVNEEGVASRNVTASYFVGERFGKYKNYDIVSLVADPDDLFGDKGIYVLGEKNKDYKLGLEMGKEPEEVEPANYLMHGKESSRDASVEIYNEEGENTLTQNVRINVNGNFSRIGPFKSFRVVASTKFGNNDRLEYGDLYINSFLKSILIRNGFGQNQWMQELLSEREVTIQNYRPCVLFLDGEYWGEYCIQERCSPEYLENHYNIPSEQVVLVRAGEVVGNSWDESYAAYTQCYLDFQAMIQTWYDSGTDQYDAICDVIDIQSYIDYLCIQLYADNHDFSNSHNMAMWRSVAKTDKPYEDRKWRWILYDLDYTLVDPYRNTFTEEGTTPYTVMTDPLFVTLMRNEEFRKRFVNTFMDIANTSLSSENVLKHLDKIESKYNNTCNDSIKIFFKERRDPAFQMLKEVFELEGNQVNVILKGIQPDGGVCLNTATFTEEGRGIYYSDFTISLKTAPMAEKKVDSWKVTYDDGETVCLQGESVEIPLRGKEVQICPVYN